MDGVYAENCLEQFQRISMDGVYAENCLEQFQRISMDGVVENCSCIFDTSYIHVGRMLKIVFVTWMSLSRAMQEQRSGVPRNDFSALITDNCKLTTANDYLLFFSFVVSS